MRQARPNRIGAIHQDFAGEIQAGQRGNVGVIRGGQKNHFHPAQRLLRGQGFERRIRMLRFSHGFRVEVAGRDGDLMTGLEQIAGERAADVADAEKRDIHAFIVVLGARGSQPHDRRADAGW